MVCRQATGRPTTIGCSAWSRASRTARIEQRVHDRLEAVRRYQVKHPDLVTEAMNRLAQAYVCLTDPDARRAYDAARSGRPTPNGANRFPPRRRRSARAAAVTPPPVPPVPVPAPPPERPRRRRCPRSRRLRSPCPPRRWPSRWTHLRRLPHRSRRSPCPWPWPRPSRRAAAGPAAATAQGRPGDRGQSLARGPARPGHAPRPLPAPRPRGA